MTIPFKTEAYGGHFAAILEEYGCEIRVMVIDYRGEVISKEVYNDFDGNSELTKFLRNPKNLVKVATAMAMTVASFELNGEFYKCSPFTYPAMIGTARYYSVEKVGGRQILDEYEFKSSWVYDFRKDHGHWPLAMILKELTKRRLE